MRTHAAPDQAGERAAGEQVVAAARLMAEAGLVVGTTGNVSARVPGGLLVTPTRIAYDRLEPRDLARIGLDGTAPSPEPAPSREWPLHAAVYRARPDVGAVVHTHSVHATAWSFLDEPLMPSIEDCGYYETGPIRTARHAPGGTAALAENAVAALRDSAAVLLGRHGVLATGPTPADALTIAQVVEHQAHVAWLLRRPPGLVRPGDYPQ